MEPSPVHPATGYLIYLIYLIIGLKNLDVEVPDKLVFELPVSALRVLTSLVVCGELLMKQKSHSSACVVSEAALVDSHILLFFLLPAISGYVPPPFL